jgi:DNA-binding transcriptional LysR family regulator
MRYRLPSLNALRAFEATARNGSLSAAGRELNVSAGAVSRHIALLEAHFETTLFVRQPTGMALTVPGSEYFRQVAFAFDTIDKASEHLLPRSDDHVRFHAYTSLATEWLAPRISRFQARFPEADVQMIFSTSEGSFGDRSVDLAVSASNDIADEIRAEDLFPSQYMLVASRTVAENLASMADLLAEGAPPIVFARREAAVWEALFSRAGLGAPPFSRGLEFDNLSLTYQAARQGAGVALGLLFLIADDLQSGRLATAVPTIIEMENSHKLLYRKSRASRRPLIDLRVWLQETAGATNQMVAEFIAREGLALAQR